MNINISGAGNQTNFNWPGKYKWLINQAALEIEVPPENDPDELSYFVEQVFSKLEHTPFTGIGQNFTFEGNLDEIDIKFTKMDEWKLNKKSTWGGTVSNIKNEISFIVSDSSKLNIYLTNNGEKNTIKFNFHNDASTARQLIDLAQDFNNNLTRAKEYLKEITN